MQRVIGWYFTGFFAQGGKFAYIKDGRINQWPIRMQVSLIKENFYKWENFRVISIKQCDPRKKYKGARKIWKQHLIDGLGLEGYKPVMSWFRIHFSACSLGMISIAYEPVSRATNWM